MKSVVVTVTTSPTLLVAADDIFRTIYIHNAVGQVIYVGNSTVTTSTGYHIAGGDHQNFDIPSKQTLYAVTASSTNDVIVLTPDLD